MEILANITGLEYKTHIHSDLETILFSEFDVNSAKANCIIKDNNYIYGFSRWISPKRTRSYPFEKVYNTLNCSKRITLIPIIKDEGKDGDRDFIQWDTVSLMSLLDVYIIFGYYVDAEKNVRYTDKITNQKFDNNYVKSKIKEIEQYHSSALHWNLKELNNNFFSLIDKVERSYLYLSLNCNVKMHNPQSYKRFCTEFLNGVNTFMEASRMRAKDAQNREYSTTQINERLRTDSKAKLTIKNYLGGLYYLTVDEIEINGYVKLIESKHSNRYLLPSLADIKDGLLKMVLYSNLEKIIIEDKKKKVVPVLRLTSIKIKGEIYSNYSQSKIEKFLNENSFTQKNIEIINLLINEANENDFIINIGSSL